MKIKALPIATILLGAGILALVGYSSSSSATFCGKGAGNIKDEALCVGRTAESLPSADEDYFRDMDYGATKNPEQVAADLCALCSGDLAGEGRQGRGDRPQ